MQHLSSLDAMLLHRDVPTEPRQVATLAILRAGNPPLDHARLMQVIADRIDMIPRYRQVPRSAPAGLGMPVWVDDESFDLSLHVRRSAVAPPGDRAALADLVGRLVARRLDHERPLWELYVIEGLADGGLALLFKAHQVLVDGSHTVDLAQVLLEETPRDRDLPHETWVPRRAPGGLELAVQGVLGQAESPSYFLDNVRYHADKLATGMPHARRSELAHGPLTGRLGQYRRFATLDVELDRLRAVRTLHGGTVNDVILAGIAGGLRGWMLTRAEPLRAHDRFRALVPMSIGGEAEGSMPTSFGSRVLGHPVSLPVGEPNAVVRLHQISYALKGHRETSAVVAANKLAELPGFATSTFHAVGARVAARESRKPHQLVITNVPGPQKPVYMAGQELAEVYPALPLTDDRLLSIGVTSYHGRVFFGLVADREAGADLAVLAECIRESLDELGDAASVVGRAPRGKERR